MSKTDVFEWPCGKCGRKEMNPATGVSVDYELVAMWKCKGCGEYMVTGIPLQEIIDNAPKEDARLLSPEELASIRSLSMWTN